MEQITGNFFESHFRSGQCKPLLALSGGVDSMVLAHLMLASNIPFEAAHINFGLRGVESDGDQEFVSRFCTDNKIVLHTQRMDAKQEAAKLKKGIQETARILRYRWFRQLLNEKELTHIVTAHHQNDQAETMLFNFVRGSGIGGLSGMKEVEADLLRPLLPVSKTAILDYASSRGVKYREDASNKSTGYARNRLRLKVFPELEKINPGISHSLFHSSKIFSQAEQLIEERLGNDLEENLQIDKTHQTLKTTWLATYPYARLLLWHWLKNFGFTSAQIDEAMQLLSSQSGKFILSATHRLLRNRDQIVLCVNTQEAVAEAWINEGDSEIKMPVHLNIFKTRVEEISFSSDKNEAWLDYDLLKFPLCIRPWQQGDSFRPLGMKGSKKVSDLLISAKVPLHLKQNVLVLLSGDVIAWVMGYQISCEFSITPQTRQVIHIILHAG